MEGKRLWVGRLKEEFQKSPLVSNVAFGFILMGLERLVELEFECPCDPQYNRTFSSAFFVVPAIMAFLFMLIIQGCRCRKQCSKTGFFASFIPAVVWLILMLFDGQYFTCAMTHWEGRFVPLAQGVPQKWCKPIHDGNVDFQEQMLYSQKQFVISQVIGIVLLIFICFGLTFYLCMKSCHQDEEEQAEEDPELQEMTRMRQ